MSDIPCECLWTYASDSVGVDEALARAGRKRSRPTGVLQKPEFSNNLKRLLEPPPHPKREKSQCFKTKHSSSHKYLQRNQTKTPIINRGLWSVISGVGAPITDE